MQEKIYEILKGAHNVALLPHENIDGDALSACFALKDFIGKLGGSATILIEGDIPLNLRFLGDDYEQFMPNDKVTHHEICVAVDCGTADRLAARESIFENADTKIVIDHHETNNGYGDFCYVSPESAATCEIIYSLFEKNGVEISTQTAEYLYAGILTDTGGFRYSNTTPRTFEIASQLLKKGIDFAAISTKIFETKSLTELKMECMAIDTAKFYHDGKTVVSYISGEMMKSVGAKESDLSNISSVLRGIDGVCTAVMLKESGDKIRASMRSKDMVNVAEICSVFGGGGHERAAGATFHVSAEEAEKKIIPLIGEYYERYN